MATTRLTCPACHAVLRSAQELPSGKRIKCSACATVFAVGEAAAPAKTAPTVQPSRRLPEAEADEDFEHRPSRRRSQPPIQKPATNLPVVLTFCAIGAVVFIGIVAAGIVGAIWYFSGDKNREFNEANNPRPVIVTGGGPKLEDLLKPGAGPKVGESAPEISGEDFDGKRFKLSEFRGKVVLLDFWGDWCPHCAKMYPHQRELVKKYEKKPFVMLGVNTDGSKEKGRTLALRGEINWRNWWDGQLGPIAAQWSVNAFPTTYVIDHKGVIQEIILGAQSASTYEGAVARLLKNVETK